MLVTLVLARNFLLVRSSIVDAFLLVGDHATALMIGKLQLVSGCLEGRALRGELRSTITVSRCKLFLGEQLGVFDSGEFS